MFDDYEKLIDYGIANEDEINLITDIYGITRSTFTDILYARTGYRSFEQYENEETY